MITVPDNIEAEAEKSPLESPNIVSLASGVDWGLMVLSENQEILYKNQKKIYELLQKVYNKL